MFKNCVSYKVYEALLFRQPQLGWTQHDVNQSFHRQYHPRLPILYLEIHLPNHLEAGNKGRMNQKRARKDLKVRVLSPSFKYHLKPSFKNVHYKK